MFPVPNLAAGCAALKRSFMIWLMRHESCCRFLVCSLSIAFSSRSVAAAVNSGFTKKRAKRSSAGSSASCAPPVP